MTATVPLNLIASLLKRRRKTRKMIDDDIEDLERLHTLLIKSVSAFGGHESLEPAPQGDSAFSPVHITVVTVQGTWHESVLQEFEDGLTHTTAEIYKTARAASGGAVGYSAVASWLNRMAERGALKKDGRGSYSSPAFHPRIKSGASSEEAFAA